MGAVMAETGIIAEQPVAEPVVVAQSAVAEAVTAQPAVSVGADTGTDVSAYVSVPPAESKPVAEEEGNVFGFHGEMVLLTWVAFLISAVLLGKFLWKPILRVLEDRENEIREAAEEAVAARKAAAEADTLATEKIAAAETEARAKADALVLAAQQRAAAMEAEARTAIAAKQRASDERMAAERADALKRLGEQAGDEIAAALEKMLPGLLTDEQRKVYQERIAAEVRF